MSANIYCYGDSITHGVADARGGWVDRIKQDYFNVQLENPDAEVPTVYNLGIDGDSADDLVKRLPSEIEAQQKPWSQPNDLYVVAIGVNDSREQQGHGAHVSSPEHYYDQLGLTVKLIQKRSENILFIGLLPVGGEVVSFPSGDTYTFKRVEAFSQILDRFCREHAFSMVPIFEPMLGVDYQTMLLDGLHPNSKGHAWMHNQIKPYIQRMVQ